ncbi:MAG: class I SAM-dependent methyltransferase [Anaerolineales bacterium]|nr:class I SAM-dependent methyltransferase [Anaerolineales bacterium]
MKGTGEEMAQYIESCRKEFWQNVFRLELAYLADHLRGCREVLSIGCGPAVIEGGLAERGFRVTGLDVSREALHCAPDRIRTVEAPAEEMPFPEESFDAVIYVASLQFIDHYRTALDKSALVLRPNGRILILLLNPESGYFSIKSRDAGSYISKIKHTDLKAIEAAVQERFAVRGEYYLSVEGSTVSAGPADAGSVLYILSGVKRDAKQGKEEAHA